MKRYFYVLIFALILITGCTNKNQIVNNKHITICVYNSNGEEIYNNQLNTSENILLDVLTTLDVKLSYKDDKYGAYINSLMDYEQKKTDGGLYYWAYYIDDEYADTGISNCIVEDGKTYKFVYEFYKN